MYLEDYQRFLKFSIKEGATLYQFEGITSKAIVSNIIKHHTTDFCITRAGKCVCGTFPETKELKKAMRSVFIIIEKLNEGS